MQLMTRRHEIKRGTQDFYHFRLEGLAKLAAKHGSQSEEFAHGLQLAEHLIRQVLYNYRC
jgi:hypothetical protein